MASSFLPRRSFAFLIALGAAGTMAACASSSSDEPVQGAGPTEPGPDGGPAVEAPKPHLACGDAQAAPLAKDIGKSCSMGSNLPLCASKSSSGSCSTSLCLWDDTDPTASFGDAYCTAACDPAGKDTCPSGFACQAQGCSSAPLYVCARKAGAKAACESPTLAGRTLGLRAPAAGSDGRLYVVGSASQPVATVILSRAKGETAWTKIYEAADVGTNNYTYLQPMRAGGAVYLPLTRDSIAIVKGTDVKVATLPKCPSGSNDCPINVQFLFAGTSGDARLVANDNRNVQYAGALVPGEIALSKSPADPTLGTVIPLADGGLLATCKSATSSVSLPCTSTDGVRFTDLELPKGEVFAKLVAAGKSVDDFYFLVGSGAVYHRIGGTWLKEGIAGNPAEGGSFGASAMVRAADGTIVARLDEPRVYSDGGSYTQPSKTYVLSSDCWSLAPNDLRIDGFFSEGRDYLTTGSASGGMTVCTQTLPVR